MTEPPRRPFNWEGSHRLLNSKYSQPATVLSAIADNDADLANLSILDSATNDLTRADQQGLIGINNYEQIHGVPHAEIVRAAFAHPGPSGSRFNDNTRGAWYAAEILACSIAEIVYHRSRNLADSIVPEGPSGLQPTDQSTYDDWRADFRAAFHVLDPATEFLEYLQPEPVPQCYSESQAFARHLLNQRSNGLVYPSVRHPGSQCIACFRPVLVYNPRNAQRLQINMHATRTGYEHSVCVVSA